MTWKIYPLFLNSTHLQVDSGLKIKSLLLSIKRVFADYSLRRFLVYAASPMNWGKLRTLKLQADEDTRRFFDDVNKWQNTEAKHSLELGLVFRPWLRKERKSLPCLIGKEFVADSQSPDPEIRMRVDRLSWLLPMVVHDDNHVWKAVAEWLENRWKHGLACRGSYSISERVSNLILCWNVQEPEPSLKTEVLHMIEADTDYLLAHLEYYGERGTNNHILNNARALILAGAFLKSDKFYGAGCWLFERQLEKHVSEDGVFREASTHYQWVISRWMVEVGCAFYLADRDRFERFRPLLSSMLDVCGAMLMGNNVRKYLPLLGDISPDFPPHWYGGMLQFGNALVSCGEHEELLPLATDGIWSRLFIGRVKSVPKNWVAKDKSWVRLANCEWSLVSHADRQTDDNRATHGHHDLFSFELAFAGIPVVIDPGRRNYLSGRDYEEAGIIEEWHNTILVDGCRTGFVARGYMPVLWLRSIRTRPDVVVEDQCLEIRLDTPREVPGITCIRRVFELTNEKAVLISNQITKAKRTAASVKLVMYVTGKGYWVEKGLRLETGGFNFLIYWRNLDVPCLRPATRYTGYELSEPCTRLEWSVAVTESNWESSIVVALDENP